MRKKKRLQCHLQALKNVVETYFFIFYLWYEGETWGSLEAKNS